VKRRCFLFGRVCKQYETLAHIWQDQILPDPWLSAECKRAQVATHMLRLNRGKSDLSHLGRQPEDRPPGVPSIKWIQHTVHLGVGMVCSAWQLPMMPEECWRRSLQTTSFPRARRALELPEFSKTTHSRRGRTTIHLSSLMTCPACLPLPVPLPVP